MFYFDAIILNDATFEEEKAVGFADGNTYSEAIKSIEDDYGANNICVINHLEKLYTEGDGPTTTIDELRKFLSRFGYKIININEHLQSEYF